MENFWLYFVSIILAGVFGFMYQKIRQEKKQQRANKFNIDTSIKAYISGYHQGKTFELLGTPELRGKTSPELLEIFQNDLWKATEAYTQNFQNGSLETKHVAEVVWLAHICLNAANQSDKEI